MAAHAVARTTPGGKNKDACAAICSVLIFVLDDQSKEPVLSSADFRGETPPSQGKQLQPDGLLIV